MRTHSFVASVGLCAALVIAAAVSAFAQSAPSHQDGPRPTTVTLATGDRVSGVLEPSSAEGLALQTQAFGPMELPWTAVASVEFGVPVRVRLNDGTQAAGVATWKDGAVIVRGANGADTTAPVAQIAVLQWTDQPAPTWEDHWNITGTASTQAARGNSETTSLNAGGSATYRGTRTGIGLYANRSYSSAGRPGSSETTGDTAVAGGRVDRYLIDRGFAFASTDFKYDRFQQVQRFWGTVGAGFDVVSTKKLAMTFSAGLSRGRDGVKSLVQTGVLAGNQAELSRTYNQLQLGEGLRWKGWRRGTVLSQDVTVYRQVGNASVAASVVAAGQGVTLRIPATGYLRVESSSRLQAPINNRLSLQASLQDSYTNHPYPGSKSNDVSVSLGLNLQIGKQSLGSYNGSSSNVGTLAGSDALSSVSADRSERKD